MKTVKYSTKNLTCYASKDLQGSEFYQIFENENQDTPVAIYVDQNTMHLRQDFPKEEFTYKYFNEMCEIVEWLYNGN